jgi:hypothetical protein
MGVKGFAADRMVTCFFAAQQYNTEACQSNGIGQSFF